MPNSRKMRGVNISIETDEDDLIGGNTLVDGNVVYREGFLCDCHEERCDSHSG